MSSSVLSDQAKKNLIKKYNLPDNASINQIFEAMAVAPDLPVGMRAAAKALLKVIALRESNETGGRIIKSNGLLKN